MSGHAQWQMVPDSPVAPGDERENQPHEPGEQLEGAAVHVGYHLIVEPQGLNLCSAKPGYPMTNGRDRTALRSAGRVDRARPGICHPQDRRLLFLDLDQRRL